MIHIGNHQTQPLWSREGKNPIRELWVAVLTRAIHDAFGQNDYTEARRALAWLKGRSQDFREVCEYAGRNPDYVYKKLIKPLNESEKNYEDLQKDPFHTDPQSYLP